MEDLLQPDADPESVLQAQYEIELQGDRGDARESAAEALALPLPPQPQATRSVGARAIVRMWVSSLRVMEKAFAFADSHKQAVQQ